MTQPVPPRPVPGPPTAARVPAPAPSPAPSPAPAPVAPATDGVAAPFAGLAGRPVAEHVAVFEAEHERLQRELSTVDQL